jgi:hypothetical protein
MMQLPKHVRERLRTSAPQNHPDADLLTAFAEGLLRVSERETVITHLAVCAECREVIALVAPDTAETAETVPMRRPWIARPMLRWATVTAAALVVSAAVMLRRAESPLPATPSEAVAVRQESPTVAHDFHQSLPAPEAEELKVAPRPKTRRDISGASAPSLEDSKRRITDKDKDIPTKIEVDEESAREDILKTQQELLVANSKLAANSEQDKLAKDEVSIASAAKVTAPASAPPAESKSDQPPASAMARMQPDFGGKSGRQLEARTAAEAAIPNRRSSVAPGHAPSYVMFAGAPVAWKISENGELLRSLDGGGSWQLIALPKGVTVRAVANVRNNVWAGGEDAAVFRSVDSGQQWETIPLSSKAKASKADAVVHISFTDEWSGLLRTASGETWITSDGGRSWMLSEKTPR